jgi:hypothetical protein
VSTMASYMQQIAGLYRGEMYWFAPHDEAAKEGPDSVEGSWGYRHGNRGFKGNMKGIMDDLKQGGEETWGLQAYCSRPSTPGLRTPGLVLQA